MNTIPKEIEMDKYEAQMRFAFAAVATIAGEMASGDFEGHSGTINMEMAGAMENYLNLVGYVSAHGMRHSGYTLRELQGNIEDLGRRGVVTQETVDAVEHYCSEVDNLYLDEPIQCGKRRASTKCECGWRSWSQNHPCQEGA